MLLVLLLCASAAIASPPNPQPAYQLSGDLTPAPAAGDQTAPTIARGGDQYLAVWNDERTAFLAADGQAGSQRDIYAARLDADGVLIDTTPIVITQDQSDQYDPVAVWNGTAWLVIWTDTEPYSSYSRHIIKGARVSAAGEVLDPEPILIRDGGTINGTSGDHFFAAASNGNDYVLLFQDEYVQGIGINFRLEARRFTSDVALAGSAMLFSPSCCYFFYHGGLAYANGVYMAVFEGYVSGSVYGIFGLRFTSSLQNLDSYPVEVVTIPMQGETHYYRTPNVAAGNGKFYVGWQLYISNASSQVFGARVGSDGVSLDGDGVPISGTLPLSLSLSPDVVWDGSQWIVGWPDDGLNLARVDAGGNVLDPGGVDLGIDSGAFVGDPAGGLQLVHAEAAGVGPTPYDVFQALVSPTLDLGADQCISLGAPAQIGADVATGSGGSMLVYRSVTSSGSSIMARALDDDGEAVSPEPALLATGNVAAPKVGFDGTRHLAVWSAGGEIHGRRLDEDGTVLDGADIVVLDGADPDVVGRDGEFLVTASQPGGAHAARVGGDGAVIDVPALLLGTGGNAGPVVTVLGDHYLAAWEATGAVDGSEIAMSLVAMNGSVIGPLDVTQPGDGLAHVRPAIAAGDTALIVWQDDRDGDDDLYGRRVAPTATFLDPPTGFAVAGAASNQRDPAVAWDGRQFLTVFTDDRDMVNQLDLRTDVYRSWVTRIGLVEEPAGLSLLADPAPEIEPAVAGRGGSALYAASRFTASAPYAAYRIWLRRGAVPTAVGDLPRASRMVSIYPNPANPAVTIRFRLARPGVAVVDIHDLQGARVRTLRSGELSAGDHDLSWDGRDAAGRSLASGTYLFRFRGGGADESGKVTLVR